MDEYLFYFGYFMLMDRQYEANITETFITDLFNEPSDSVLKIHDKNILIFLELSNLLLQAEFLLCGHLLYLLTFLLTMVIYESH